MKDTIKCDGIASLNVRCHMDHPYKTEQCDNSVPKEEIVLTSHQPRHNRSQYATNNNQHETSNRERHQQNCRQGFSQCRTVPQLIDSDTPTQPYKRLKVTERFTQCGFFGVS